MTCFLLCSAKFLVLQISLTFGHMMCSTLANDSTQLVLVKVYKNVVTTNFIYKAQSRHYICTDLRIYSPFSTEISFLLVFLELSANWL